MSSSYPRGQKAARNPVRSRIDTWDLYESYHGNQLDKNSEKRNNAWKYFSVCLLVWAFGLQIGVIGSWNSSPKASSDRVQRNPHDDVFNSMERGFRPQSTRRSSVPRPEPRRFLPKQRQSPERKLEEILEDIPSVEVTPVDTEDEARVEPEEEESTSSPSTKSYSEAIPNTLKDDPRISAISSAEGRLRATLLRNYDRNSFPWEWAWDQKFDLADYDRGGDNAYENKTASTDAGLRQGLPVELGLNFHKVHALNVAESTADLVVWVRIAWTDPRLMWNPEDFDGVEKAVFYVADGMGGGEASEIWTPDIYLWNQEEPLPNTLSNTYAIVTSDGGVFWSRPGRIKSTCKYGGLEKFPFDELSCALEFGSWAHSGLYYRPIPLAGVGYSVGGSETSGGSYTEFELAPEDVSVESIIYPPYPSSPEEDWPVLIYTLVFDRASAPYIRGVVLTNILLNFAAFACFWIPPHVGERMGLAITCVLAAVAGELAVAATLPVCKEMSWYAKFALGSTTFALIVVFESAVVIYFFYFVGDDLEPRGITWIRNKWIGMNKKPKNKDENKRDYMNGDKKDIPSSIRKAGAENTADPDRRVTWDNDEILEVSETLQKDEQFMAYHENDDENDDDHRNISITAVPGDRRASFAETKHTWLSERSMVMQMVDAGNFKNEREADNNARWQEVAAYIDDVSRFVIIPMYCAFLTYIFALIH